MCHILLDNLYSFGCDSVLGVMFTLTLYGPIQP